MSDNIIKFPETEQPIAAHKRQMLCPTLFSNRFGNNN